VVLERPALPRPTKSATLAGLDELAPVAPGGCNVPQVISDHSRNAPAAREREPTARPQRSGHSDRACGNGKWSAVQVQRVFDRLQQ
jgi:hypothetical protein